MIGKLHQRIDECSRLAGSAGSRISRDSKGRYSRRRHQPLGSLQLGCCRLRFSFREQKIPVIGFVWTLIENGFLRGTPGDNRFGPDLAGRL